MLLRNSSTPLVQSLFSDTPTNTTTTTILSSVHSGPHHPHHIYLTSLSCNSSPIFSRSSDFNRKTNKLTHKAFRRGRSNGSLKGLASTSFDLDELRNSNKSSKFFGKKGMGLIEENDGEEEGEEVLNEFQDLGIGEVVEPASPPMYLATSLGIGPADASAGNVEEYYKRMVGEDPSNPLFLRNCAQLLQSKGDLHGAEEYYLRATLADPKDVEILLLYAELVWKLHQDQDRALNYFKRAAQGWGLTSLLLGIDVAFVGGINAADFGKGGNTEDPSNRLFLRNYAQFADPADGEIISQYAKLVWELHHDQDKAMSYFERAVQATPEDSHVLAAYANFLWQTEKDEEEDGAVQDHIQAPLFLQAMTAANV
ncbi:hypothetical protein LOK49_LG09G00989 [Camellia lanceoleosa]|uniref:Uncharacterized protein n=1 Tax=Camellia lanceoleosa TaxID=1840588 RepID=A0ACC0GJG5_9ERIC|nr:hypothetical protein LOK49_LG09G00989 [Camellia lanceoleosa]